MSKESMILKSDGAGRVQTPVERQVALVREFERSGLSGPRFAALAGVKYQTFVTWRRKHGSGSPSRARPQTPQLTLVEAVAAAGNEDDSVMAIELPGGARLCVRHPGQVVGMGMCGIRRAARVLGMAHSTAAGAGRPARTALPARSCCSRSRKSTGNWARAKWPLGSGKLPDGRPCA